MGVPGAIGNLERPHGPSLVGLADVDELHESRLRLRQAAQRRGHFVIGVVLV